MRSAPALAVLASATLATAQCSWSSVSVSTYGQGCNAAFPGQPLSIAASLDVSQCQLDIDVTAFPGCCNAFLIGRVLVLGLGQISVPAPQIGAGCTLLASPDVVLYQPSSAGSGPFELPFANATLPPVTVYAQATGLYFTTFGLTFDWGTSAGASISLQ